MRKFLILFSVVALAVVVTGCTLKKTNTNSSGNTNKTTNEASNVNQAPQVTKAPLVILTISPVQGKVAGGDDVTITGESFLSGAKVYFGTAEATGVTVTSDKEIKAKTPKGEAGISSVKVVNPDGKTALYQNSFTFK